MWSQPQHFTFFEPCVYFLTFSNQQKITSKIKRCNCKNFTFFWGDICCVFFLLCLVTWTKKTHPNTTTSSKPLSWSGRQLSTSREVTLAGVVRLAVSCLGYRFGDEIPSYMGKPWNKDPVLNQPGFNGFNYFYLIFLFFIFTPTWGNDSIWLIFFK